MSAADRPIHRIYWDRVERSRSHASRRSRRRSRHVNWFREYRRGWAWRVRGGPRVCVYARVQRQNKSEDGEERGRKREKERERGRKIQEGRKRKAGASGERGRSHRSSKLAGEPVIVSWLRSRGFFALFLSRPPPLSNSADTFSDRYLTILCENYEFRERRNGISQTLERVATLTLISRITVLDRMMF